MLHRNSKKNDPNGGKWIGVGGKFEENESPEDCLIREVKEETGFTLTNYRFRGLVTFVSDIWETEYMHLFTADGFMVPESYYPEKIKDFHNDLAIIDSSIRYDGLLPECDEGHLEWVKKEDVRTLPTWAGDAIFLSLLMEKEEFFSLKLEYQGERLVKASVGGKELKID